MCACSPAPWCISVGNTTAAVAAGVCVCVVYVCVRRAYTEELALHCAVAQQFMCVCVDLCVCVCVLTCTLVYFSGQHDSGSATVAARGPHRSDGRAAEQGRRPRRGSARDRRQEDSQAVSLGASCVCVCVCVCVKHRACVV